MPVTPLIKHHLPPSPWSWTGPFSGREKLLLFLTQKNRRFHFFFRSLATDPPFPVVVSELSNLFHHSLIPPLWYDLSPSFPPSPTEVRADYLRPQMWAELSLFFAFHSVLVLRPPSMLAHRFFPLKNSKTAFFSVVKFFSFSVKHTQDVPEWTFVPPCILFFSLSLPCLHMTLDGEWALTLRPLFDLFPLIIRHFNPPYPAPSTSLSP